MTYVTARLAAGQQVSETSFEDLTSFTVRSVRFVNGLVRVDFDDDPNDGGPMSAEEIAAVTRRLTSDSPAEESTKADLADFNPAAVVAGRDFAAVVAQVDALTRLVLGESD